MSEQNRLIQAAKERHADASHLFEGERYSGAVSSSYYAVFNAAKALSIERGIRDRRPIKVFLRSWEGFSGMN